MFAGVLVATTTPTWLTKKDHASNSFGHDHLLLMVAGYRGRSTRSLLGRLYHIFLCNDETQQTTGERRPFRESRGVTSKLAQPTATSTVYISRYCDISLRVVIRYGAWPSRAAVSDGSVTPPTRFHQRRHEDLMRGED